MFYKNRKIKTFIFSFGLFFTLLLSACNTYNNPNPNFSENNIHIIIDTNSLHRAALPSLPEIINYSFVATPVDSSNSPVYSDSDSHPDNADFAPNEYMLKLPAGTWTITATGKNDTSQTILNGISEEFVVKTDGEYHDINIPVFFIENASEKGHCSLEIETTGTNIKKLTISGADELNGDFTVSSDAGKSIIRINKPNIPAKTYYPTLIFYTEDGTKVTIITETINIRQNLTTNTWYKTFQTPYLEYIDSTITTGESGAAKFILTQSIIDSLSSSTIYVSADGDDNYDGSYYLRYKTISAAIRRVNELNNINFDANRENPGEIERKNFYIYCSGDITETNSIDFEPDNDLNLTIAPISLGTTPQDTSISTSKLSLKGSNTNIISLNNLSFTGDISLENENTKLQLESVKTTGKLDYSDGQLILGGETYFTDFISFNKNNEKILIDNAISGTSSTIIKINLPTGTESLYTENYVILEGTGTYTNISSTDYKHFIYSDNTDLYTLRLKTVDGKTKAILQNTAGTIGPLPIHDDIDFVLFSNNPEIPDTAPYEFPIQDYLASDDKITGNITINMYVKKGEDKYLIKDDGSESLSLTLSNNSNSKLGNSTKNSNNSGDEFTIVSLTVNNIRPGVYSLLLSAIVDGFPYSKQIAINASLGD